MPFSASTSNIEDKVDDLERSVTYLADQNISLQKCLDTSNQLVSKLEQRLASLGELETFIIYCLFLHLNFNLYRNCRRREKESREN